jgi:DNA-binding IscR family transcriptional regulator
VLQLRTCKGVNPCPLHDEVDGIKNRLLQVFNQTTIGDLLNNDKKLFIRSLATH